MGAIFFSIDPAAVAILVELLGLEVFVETGTFHGDSIAAVADRFLRIYSIEIDPTLCVQAQSRFAGRPEIDIHHGASSAVLARLRAQGALAGGRVLFWLDAHWCESGAMDTAGQCPLLDELAAIGAVEGASVIAIDDARLFLAPPPSPHAVEQWPRFDAVLAALRACAPKHRIIVLNDVIWAVPARAIQTFEAYAIQSGIDWLDLAEKARNYDQILAQLHEKDAEIVRLAAAVAERHRVIETLSHQLQQGRVAAESSQDRIAELEQVAAERQLALESIHAEADRGLQVLTAIIRTRDQQITELERVAAERLAALEETEVARRAVQAEAARRAAHLEELTAVLAVRDQQTTEIKQELALFQAQERALAHEIAILRNENLLNFLARRTRGILHRKTTRGS